MAGLSRNLVTLVGLTSLAVSAALNLYLLQAVPQGKLRSPAAVAAAWNRDPGTEGQHERRCAGVHCAAAPSVVVDLCHVAPMHLV